MKTEKKLEFFNKFCSILDTNAINNTQKQKIFCWCYYNMKKINKENHN